MNYLVDIILAALFVITIVVAYHKGFFRVMLETFSVIIAFIGAALLSKLAATLFKLEGTRGILIAFAICFFVILIVVALIAKHLGGLANKIPLVGTANKVAGGIVGLVKAIFLLLILCSILGAIMNFGEVVDSEFGDAVSKSYLVRFLFQQNFWQSFFGI